MRCPYCESDISQHGGHCEACQLQLARDHGGAQRAWFPPIAASLIDASFGFGQFGWTVGSESNVASAHVLLRSMELYRVR